MSILKFFTINRTRLLAGISVLGRLMIVSTFVLAQGGGTIANGTSSGITTPGFLFEPEVPLASLKTVPTWNELEQLLDNPYAVQLCSASSAPAVYRIQNTPGNEQGFPCYSSTITRRNGFGVTLPPLLVDPLNYNPTTGEEMRLINPNYAGGQFQIPDELIQCSTPDGAALAGCDGTLTINDPAGVPTTTGPFSPDRWVWRYKTVDITAGIDRVTEGASISYNAPFASDPFTCIVTSEAVPPEGATMCGGDPGEPGYASFGILRPAGAQRNSQYSTPAIALPAGSSTSTTIPGSARLFDPQRGLIQPRNSGTGLGGLEKPSLRVPPYGTPNQPGYLVNTNPNNVTPSNENDYVRNRDAAMALGKAFFWDMQVGSDGVQSCGTCHFNGTGTDTRTKNQINPNHLGGDLTFQIHGGAAPNTYDLTVNDFPLHKLSNPDVAGDPACTTPITANINAGVLENNFPNGVTSFTVCDAGNIVSDTNDVVSSMGVVFSPFSDIATIGAFQPAVNGVKAVMPDLRTPGALDPIPGFQNIRRVEPRNTPTMQAAGFNFDNFWDGRARHDFNGGSVFGAADPQSHVWVANPPQSLTATRQIIRFSSIGSLATGPGLSEFEMSFAGRNWAKIGKKLLQGNVVNVAGSPTVVGTVTPLANQLVATNDSLLGIYSNQGGTACAGLPVQDRSGSYNPTTNPSAPGKPGLCISYPALIRRAYYPALWQNVSGMHLNGCYTDGNVALHPNQCAAGSVSIPVLSGGAVVNSAADPFDNYVLAPAAGAVNAADTNQYRQMEGNFSLFWGLSVNLWVGILIPDNTPLDQFLDNNPDAFESLGEPGEPVLVQDMINCTSATQRHCFREFGNFKRDPGLVAMINPTGEGGGGAVPVPAGGTRGPNDPDPLLGFDIFFSSNLSLKNPNFRTARCGECHAIPTLTDNTVAFTMKGQLRDFIKEFITGQPGNETPQEPLGRLRVISGFLLESEFNENGQDGVERRIINQSIVPNPSDGLAYPDGIFNPDGSAGTVGTVPGDNTYTGAGASFFDNGVYNLGVRPISEDIGRGGTDAFGWPLSLAALLMKNLGGPACEPGTPIGVAPCDGGSFDPDNGFTGGLFEETAQDQQLNPGTEGNPVAPHLPPYLAPWANQINVGDSAPELDEVFGGINTTTDIGMIEGFLDTLGPFNPAGVLNESLNMGDTTLMGTWPDVNRVGRNGSFKAPQLRNVELTGPYFHNGGKLTLRQVVDFYTRGGDFPLTNAAHRDFNMVNMDIEVQSNLTEAEKVALVDFLLELTDQRNLFDRAPFDHPEVIIPIDGTAPDNTLGRGVLLANPSLFKDIPAVGATGMLTPEPAFLNVTKVRVSGANAFPGSPACNYAGGVVSQYCH